LQATAMRCSCDRFNATFSAAHSFSFIPGCKGERIVISHLWHWRGAWL